VLLVVVATLVAVTGENARCVMSSDRGVEKALAPCLDVVSSPAAEALVADNEDEGEDEGDVSLGGRSPFAVLKLLIVAILAAVMVVKRC